MKENYICPLFTYWAWTVKIHTVPESTGQKTYFKSPNYLFNVLFTDHMVFNVWFWLVDECFKVCNYYSINTQLSSSSRSFDHITLSYHLAKSFQLFQRPKTLTKPTNMTNNRIKMTNNFNVFLPKLFCSM